MEEIGEGLAGIGQGGLAAHAVEPYSQTRGGNGHTHETACLNCATLLIGTHCHTCGQAAHVHRTLGAFFHDLLHGVLHFEGKSWRTLRMLALRPGRLTREYIEGRRARYVSPIAVFLFSIFVMFAMVQITGKTGSIAAAPPKEVSEAMKDLRKKTEERYKKAQAELEATAPGSAEHLQAEQRLDEVAGDLHDLEDAVKVAGINGMDVAVFKSGNDWLDTHVIKKWQENPKLMIYKLQSNGYKFSWLLIPLSLPFVWLMFFWKRNAGLYDHTVFVTYSIAFMSLWFIAISIVALAGGPEAAIVAMSIVVPMAHLFVHMKGTYRLSVFSTVWRVLVLVFMIQFIIGLFAILIGLLGALG